MITKWCRQQQREMSKQRMASRFTITARRPHMQNCWLYELAVGFRAAQWAELAKKLPKDSLPVDSSSSYLVASTELKKLGVVDLSAQVSGCQSRACRSSLLCSGICALCSTK